jgi:formyltetrahydrofolate synthetase
MYRIKKMRDVENNKQLQRDIQYAVDRAIENRITKIVQEVINSDGFENKMKDSVISALNQSQQMKMLDEIVIVLCTYVPELKKSKLCNP